MVNMEVKEMRVDRVRLIAEMARQEIRIQELADKASVSRSTINSMRGGKSCHRNSVVRVAEALGVDVEELLEVK